MQDGVHNDIPVGQLEVAYLESNLNRVTYERYHALNEVVT